MFTQKIVLNDLRNIAEPGIKTISTGDMKLEDYFNVTAVDERFDWNTLKFTLIKTLHCNNPQSIMPCFGLWENEFKLLITTDCTFDLYQQFPSHYQVANLILHDCETSQFKTGVHPNIEDLKTLPKDIRNKMFLYHYNDGPKPEIGSDFKGYLDKGAVIEI